MKVLHISESKETELNSPENIKKVEKDDISIIKETAKEFKNYNDRKAYTSAKVNLQKNLAARNEKTMFQAIRNMSPSESKVLKKMYDEDRIADYNSFVKSLETRNCYDKHIHYVRNNPAYIKSKNGKVFYNKGIEKHLDECKKNINCCIKKGDNLTEEEKCQNKIYRNIRAKLDTIKNENISSEIKELKQTKIRKFFYISRQDLEDSGQPNKLHYVASKAIKFNLKAVLTVASAVAPQNYEVYDHYKQITDSYDQVAHIKRRFGEKFKESGFVTKKWFIASRITRDVTKLSFMGIKHFTGMQMSPEEKNKIYQDIKTAMKLSESHDEIRKTIKRIESEDGSNVQTATTDEIKAKSNNSNKKRL